MSGRGEGVMGNREVPRIGILRLRADLRGARAEASPGEEGGSWGKPGFPQGSEATREEMLRALRDAADRERAREHVGAASA